MIMLTGNYAFFNWLSLSLCLFLFDDAQLERLIRRVWIERRTKATVNFVSPAFRQGAVFCRRVGHIPAEFDVHAAGSWVSDPSGRSYAHLDRGAVGITSSYGLFATMTTIRPEIVIEGSNDGSDWREYEFRYKPGAWTAGHRGSLRTSLESIGRCGLPH